MVDGTNGQVLSTDGNGVAYWGTISAGSFALDGLSDVIITSPSTGQILRYGIPAGSGEVNPVWHNVTPNYLTPSSSIDALGDVTISTATTGQILQWSGSAWVNATLTTAGYVSKVQHEVKAGEAITKGKAVYVTGADGTNMVVGLASNTGEGTSSKTMGIALSTAAVNGKFFVVTEGLIDGLNTSTATAGDAVWLGTNGNLIFGLVNKPVAPAHLVYLGVVTRVNQNNGEIFVHVQNGFELKELHDVLINGVSTGQLIRRDSDGLWKNWTPNFLTAHPGILAASSVNNSNGTVIQDITLEANGHVTGLASVDLDTRYYTESEIDSFFGGETEIDGYNRGAWDVAYNDKINSASFSTTTGVLTLTQQDTGTLTVDLDGRYLESLPTATSTVLGGIKVGTNLSISSGVLSATDTITSVGIDGDLSTGNIELRGGGATTVTKSGRTITITSTDTDTNTTYSAGTGLTLSGTTFSVTSGTYAASSHTHAASDITSGTLSTDRLPKQELGISIVGNFGQWQPHSAYTNFNTDVAYWGWNYVQGNTNAPHQISQQWYRGRFSLGDEYGFGTSPGDYWMEIAIPRYNQSSTSGNLFVRTAENGVINGWQGVRAAYATDAAYAADAGYAEESGYSVSSGSVEWTNVQSKPATFPPSAHNHDDRYYTETESDSRFYLATNPNGYITGISFANVSSKPTTIAGYGITDAITTSNIGSQSVSFATSSGNSSLLKSLANYVWSSSTNGRDFQEGMQVSFVSNNEGYQSYGSVVRVHTYPNDGASAELYFPYSEQYGGNSMQYRLGLYPNDGWSSWKTVIDSENIGSFALTSLPAHTHTIANVTGLQTALDGKAASSHTHTIAEVTGLQTALDSKLTSESDPVYTSERDSLLLNKTIQPTLLFSTLEHYNKPSGYSTMIQPSSYQNPLPSHGYYHIIARRDTGGGYGALLQSYNTHELYHGNTTQNTSDISWYKVWTSGDFTSTSVSNWNTAYNDRISSAAVTGTTTKTLTLTQGDGGTVTATWTDYDTDTDAQQLTWDKPSTTLSISNGNSVALEGLATESFVTGQGYITGDYLPLTGGTVTGTVTANRFSGRNTLVLNNYTTVNPASNVFLYSQPNDRDAWIFLDSADTGSNWGIYHRQIDSAVGDIPGNSLGFVGGGASALQAYINLGNGDAYFRGNLVIGGTFTEQSSIRYKENVKSIPSVSQKVEQLDAVSYNKIGGNQEEIGLIAEDVVELFPEVVKYDNEGRPDGVNYSRLSVILLKAVQELTERVNKLENK